jgi:iron complex transport system permease protein
MLYVRLPRTVGALLAGSGLSISGAVIQRVLNNPLAGPGIIGVNSGAGFVAVLFCAAIPLPLSLPLGTFLGAIATILIVYAIAERAGSGRNSIILAGAAISALMSAAINAVATLRPDAISGFHSFQLGSFSGITWSKLTFGGIIIAAAFVVLLFACAELDILMLGTETAQSLGLNVRFFKLLFLILAGGCAGAAVSFSGLIGFVGLIIPHFVRLLGQSESSRKHVALSAAIGGGFMIFCDTAARVLFAPFELPVGILTATLGAPFFLWVLLTRRKQR